MAQHALALAMDKDNLLALLGAVFIQHFLELANLIVEDIGMRHASSAVEKSVNVQVDNQFVVIARTRCRLWLGGSIFARHQTGRFNVACHLALQFSGIDMERMRNLVVLYNGVQQCRCVEINGLLERVEFIELDGVKPKLNLNDRFKDERLLSLVGKELESHLEKAVELFSSYLFYI